MSTMKDIAKHAGVGLGTVSRVVNGTGPVSDETRDRVHAAIKELDYRPNRIARKLVSGSRGAGFFGVLMPLFIHPFYFYILRGIYRFVEEMDMNLILFNRGKHPEQAMSHILQEDIIGLFVMSHDLSRDEEQMLNHEKLRYCFLDYHKPHRPSVYVDNRYGGMLAADHIISRGLKYPAFVGDVGNPQQQIDRFNGFQHRLRNADISVIGKKLVPNQFESDTAVEELLKEHPEIDSLFFFSDSHALESLPAVAKWEKQLEIIGYDDLDFTGFLGLTTIHQPKDEIGYEGARLLHSIIKGSERQGDQEIILKPGISVRGPLALEHLKNRNIP